MARQLYLGDSDVIASEESHYRRKEVSDWISVGVLITVMIEDMIIVHC